MKILWKLFIFGIILRMMPIVLTSMGIFSNTLGPSGVHFDSNNFDFNSLLLLIISPMGQGAGFTIYGYTFSISFLGTAIMGAVVVLLVLKSSAIQYIAGFFVAGLIIPFLLEIGVDLLTQAKAFGSLPTNLIIVTIMTALAAFGVLTLIDIISGQSQDTED